MNLNFQLIKSNKYKGLPTLQKLYEAAFPEKERRKFNQLMQMLQESAMCFYAIKAEESIVGLCICWHFHEFLFLEHLAIEPACRGKGIGKKIVNWLLNQENRTIVLEVERPTDEISVKRIRFYEQLGFTLHDTYDYHQPPYERNAPPVPLYLMSNPKIGSTSKLEEVAAKIKQQVYEQFYS